ncbi:hypothetical protein COBT_001935 [Conglomerata obtusa]
MDDLKYTVFSAGIYGIKISNFGIDNFLKTTSDECFELLSPSERIDLMENFKIKSHISVKEYITEHENINDTDHKLLFKTIKDYYIKINLYTWKQMATGNIFNFKNDEFYLMINKFVTSDDFIDIKLMYKGYNTNAKKSFKKFIDKMIVYELFETEKIENRVFYRLTRKDGRVAIYNYDNSASKKPMEAKPNIVVNEFNQLTILRMLKKDMLDSEIGILCNEVSHKYNIKSKTMLRLLKGIVDKDDEYEAIAETEGKINRYRFFHRQHVEQYKKKLQKVETCNSVILPEDKISKMKIMLDELKVFFPNKIISEKYAKLIGSKYVPDNKNFRQIAVKAGGKIIQHIFDSNNANKYIICSSSATQKDFEDFKIKIQPQKQKNTINKFQLKLYTYFVKFDTYISQDNGFIANEEYRNYRFLLFIQQRCDDNRKINFNMTFIRSMTLKQIMTFIPFPYYLEEYRFEDRNYNFFNIREVKDPAISLELPFPLNITCGEFIDKNYNNYNILKIKSLFAVNAFKSFFTNKNNHKYFSYEEKENEFFLVFNHNDINVVEDDRNNNLHANIYERIQFYNLVKDIDKINFVINVYNVLEDNFEGEAYEALYQRFIEYKRRTCLLGHLPDRDFILPGRLYNLYKKIKELFIIKNKLKENEIDIGNYHDNKKVLHYLIKDNTIEKNQNSYYKFTSIYDLRYNANKINTYFPVNYMSVHQTQIEHKTYYKHFYNLVNYYLIQSGSIKFETLLKKIYVMKNFELYEFLETYKNIFIMKNINNVCFVSLV